uniref:Uncharacterized protein n=1 Tax=Panagrolaimus sp. PS1159 TaxID=55785 RepID=A0AC35EWV7_9BILA
MNNLDALSSDGQNYEQDDNDIKFVENVREGIELELENKQLMFKLCSDGCMAGVSEKDGKMLLQFKDDTYNKRFDTDSYICATATMAFPDAALTLTDKFPSCEPLKHDGNVVKLYVNHVEPGCPFYVKKAPKEKKAPINPKPSKEVTQENGTKEDAPPVKKVSTEPTLENPTTEKSVVHHKLPGNPPRASVSKKVILPAMNSDGFKSVSLFDTLSGADDDETQNSIHAFEKPRKNKAAGRKKSSKKHR